MTQNDCSSHPCFLLLPLFQMKPDEAAAGLWTKTWVINAAQAYILWGRASTSLRPWFIDLGHHQAQCVFLLSFEVRIMARVPAPT